MGQYQQWLQYRYNERHLQAQLEELAEELAQLQQREQALRQALQPPASAVEGNVGMPLLPPLPYNSLARALAVILNNAESAQDTRAGTIQTANLTQQRQSAEASTTISQALYSQSHLPDNMLPYATGVESGNDPFQPLLNRNNGLPPIPYSDPVMLPEDMGAFLDEHTETEPRVALPWWIRNAGVLNPNGPVDQESARTNRLVQRWIERWGRHPMQPDQTRPPENGGKASS